MSTPDVMIVTRVFDATPQQIWDAFTDPDKLHKFFGPKGTHIPREEVTLDVRVGGEFSVTMHNDENDETYPMKAEYVLIEEPTKFQLRTGRGGDITIELRDLGIDGKTLLTWTAQSNDGPMEESFYAGMTIGVHSTVDNLGELLAGVGVQS